MTQRWSTTSSPLVPTVGPMTSDQLQVMRTIDRLAGRPKVGIALLALESGLTGDAIREVLQELHPLYATFNALPGDRQTLFEVRAVQLTDYGRSALSHSDGTVAQ